ncbi:MAG TPA: hypothetical protein PKE21_03005 [Flavobacteriales bacterium]|nr:hypothetical protein [Flavobacteriales bacterium]HMR26425.1 hypothetical protein [Flavobacteriales bacterium]
MNRINDMEALRSTVVPTRRKAPLLFTALCVLTILGNVLLILVNLLKAGMLQVGEANGSVGQSATGPLNTLVLVVVLTCVGAAVGAALMLGGRRLGFHIYAASNIVHILATVGVMLLWFMTVYLSFVGVLLFFYCFIPVGFLLYFRRYGGGLR